MKHETMLRQYEKTDYDFVFDVKKIVYKKYVDEFFGGWDDAAQRKMLDEFIQSEKENIKIVLYGDERIGFINGKLLESGEYEQGNICILPRWQGKGIGTALLNKVFAEHKNCDIVLRVFKSNPAKRLYERLGFETYSETPSHFLMRKRHF